MNAEIHALTGAYALDAVSDGERVEFERHLAECESCAQEVAELRDTATRLALVAAQDPPPELKSRVRTQIRTVRQLPPETTVVPMRRRDRRTFALRLSTVAAAVLLVAAVALGVVVARQNQELNQTRAQAAEISELLRAGDARVLTLDEGENGAMTVAMSRSANRMLLLTKDLPNPPEGRDFQVWKGQDGEMTSAGFLNPDDGNAFLAVTGIGAADQVAVTVEPDGGSPQPTTLPPVMSVDLPA
ncbi:MAG: anti-sigma factor [Pseudonocardiaceae bacterium]|nr:anti-sigma factor [Pseudonocardiaceae bacterium]